MTYLLRRATLHDLPDVLAILGARAEWLAEHGLDQWQVRDPARDTEDSIGRGDTWVLTYQWNTVATMTMTTVADRDFWTEQDRAAPALYISKLATRLDIAGKGLGALLVDCAASYSARRRIERLRWDVWRTNRRLQAYYADLGATHLRTVDVAGRSSGALFELTSRGRTPESARVLDPIGTLATIPGRVREYPSLGVPREELGDHGPVPSHSHVLEGLEVVDKMNFGDQPVSVTINGDIEADQATLINAGDGWREFWYMPMSLPASGDLLATLRPGRIYQLRHVGTRPYCTVSLCGDVDNDDSTPAET